MTTNNTQVSGARQVCRYGRVRWLGSVLLFLAAVGASATTGWAQDGSTGRESPSGRLLGHVLDGGTGEPVPQAQVSVLGGPSTLSDLNGRFVVSGVRPGTVEVTVRALGYAVKTVTGVEVSPDELATLDITLEQQALQMEGIRVSAVREKGSVAYLLDERKSADAMVEAVGAQEIGRRPDSDAAEVARRMSGITVSEGKYVFIRGLGQRYSQTTLNGSSLPSPEPEREAVPLDLFPSAFLESLTAQKSYTPDLTADFSGGSVRIRTKDFPSHFAGRFGVSSSVNTRSQFQGGFLRYQGGGMDWLGLDDGTRGQPEVVAELMGGVRSGRRLPTDPGQLIRIGEALRGGEQRFAPVTGEAPISRSFDLSLGGRADFGDESELGYFLAGSYSDGYSTRPGEIERKWRAEAFREGTAELSTPNVDYTFTRGTRNVSWGSIANLAFKPSPRHQLNLKTTISLDTDDEARVYTGENNEDIGGEIRSERSRFVQRLMTWGQLSGEHLTPLDARLDWRLTGARARRDEPLLRETIYLRDPQSEKFLLLDFTESARYFYSELVDDDLSAELDWRVPFSVFDGTGSVKVGGAYRMRDRGFGARRLNWRFRGGSIPDLDAALEAGEIVAGSPASAHEFAIDEVVEPGDVYDVEDRRAAAYAMVEVPVTGRLLASVGARLESYSLALTSRDRTLRDLDQIDIAPSLNLVYSPAGEVQLRAAASRTLDRPEFRELAPFQFTEATSLRQLVGNPKLVPAQITSVDLRADWFASPREMVSLGAFYKGLRAPIEQVFIAAASSAYSFQNAESATVWGVEGDLQVGLGRLADPLRHFAFQGNYSWIRSEVSVQAEGVFQPTHLERPLEGQAPYVLNTGLTYAGPSDIEAGLFFNRFGQRLTAAGGSGLPDIYERPRNILDGSFGFPVRSGVRAKLKGTNLLDAEFRFEQSANGYTRVQRSYTVGRTFSVGLSWEF